MLAVLLLPCLAVDDLCAEERTCHVLSPMASSPELLRYHLAADKAGVPIMDDRRNDAYALGVTLFSLLSCATRHWALMFRPSMAAYQQIRAAAPSEKTTRTMLAFQQQQSVWVRPVLATLCSSAGILSVVMDVLHIFASTGRWKPCNTSLVADPCESSLPQSEMQMDL